MNYWDTVDENHFIDQRTFSNIHFSMTLPQVTLYDDKIEFEFQYKSKSGGELVNNILLGVQIIDIFNQKTELIDGTKKLIYGKMSKVNVFVPFEKKSHLTKAHVSFLFLNSNGQKIIISYYYEKATIPALVQVERCNMIEFEKNKFIELISSTVPDNENHKLKNDVVDSKEVFPLLLQNYVDALHKEIYFLRNNGGKKYKVTNGVHLSSGKEGYSYLFEMESELFLPDDAPITIETNAGIHAVGSVLTCEDFQILVMVDKDLGEKILYSYIGIEPWKLLVAQVERISRINPKDTKIAWELINDGPKLATKQSIFQIERGQNQVKEKVRRENITVVWGPPGTGKTHVMSELAIEFLKMGKSVLVVSHSNVSVDGVIKKIAEMIRSTSDKSLLKSGNVLRYGYVRDPELSKDEFATSFNFAMLHCDELKCQLDNLFIEKDELKQKEELDGVHLVALEKKIKAIRTKIRLEERIYVDKARLIGTTVSKAIVDSLFDEKQYDLVMFDEISMAYVTQIASAATLAKSKLICVGDFMQLAPISQDKIAKETLEIDIFGFLHIIDRQGNLYNHPWLVMLDEQRRMHPDISKFVSKRVYKNLLRDYPGLLVERKVIVSKSPMIGHAMNMIDLSGTYCAASKNVENSRFNILSAIVSFGTALTAEENEIDSVGVITPYAAQTRLIRAMIKDYATTYKSNVTCATVHQFQGSESDVIVFDAVESYPSSKAGWLMSKDLGAVQRLINVAITRSRGKFINVANGKFWQKEFGQHKNHIYYQLVNYLLDNHNIVSQKNKNLSNYIRSLNTGNNIKLFSGQEECIDLIKKDFEKAKEKIIISIPDGQLKDDAKNVMELIRQAKKRGVDILIKSNTCASLPTEWSEYSVSTDNAYFPIVLIDNKTMWYGIPSAKGEFKVGDCSFITVCNVIARIKGENTIEMITSLSNLAFEQVGMTKIPLGIKYDIHNSGGNNIMPGLAVHVTEKEFCPKCKNHLVLVKGKSGKFYLRCSDIKCTHTEFLTKEMVNHYIQMKNITCPQDHGEIHGGLGQYGIYIKCEYGHYLKADQI